MSAARGRRAGGPGDPCAWTAGWRGFSLLCLGDFPRRARASHLHRMERRLVRALVLIGSTLDGVGLVAAGVVATVLRLHLG